MPKPNVPEKIDQCDKSKLGILADRDSALRDLYKITLIQTNQENGLKIEILSRPTNCPRKVESRDFISVHYSGELTNGNVFDSSYQRNEPFTFKIGIGQVIKGWDQGIIGMCIGEKRELVVPPELGYGQMVSIDKNHFQKSNLCHFSTENPFFKTIHKTFHPQHSFSKKKKIEGTPILKLAMVKR